MGLVPPARGPFGEARDEEVVGVVVLGVAAAHLGEHVEDLALGPDDPGEPEQPEPGGGVGGGERGGPLARLAGPLGVLPAAQGALDTGEGEQGRGVRGAGFGLEPVPGPGGGVRLAGERGQPVAPAVPVVAGVEQQGAGGLAAALEQRGAGGAQFGVVQGVVVAAGEVRGGGAGGGRAGPALVEQGREW